MDWNTYNKKPPPTCLPSGRLSLIVVIRENKNAHTLGEVVQALDLLSTPY